MRPTGPTPSNETYPSNETTSPFQKHPVHYMYYNAGLDSEHFKSHIAEVDTVRELLLTICAH